MIKHLSRFKLVYESYGFSYGFSESLNIKYDINKCKENRNEYDKEVIKKVFDLLDNSECVYMIEKVSAKIEYDNNIRITYRYEGNSGYYDFDLSFYLVYVTDNDELVLCGTIEQCVHDLFEDIITDKIIPQWVKDLGLVNHK